jgi:large subunit ribosomal protein L1
MAHKGKNYNNAKGKVDRDKFYTVSEAFQVLKDAGYAKFDESIDIAICTGLDTRHADQQLRGAFSLPKGSGKEVRVAVFAGGEKEVEAREAGADIIGGEDLAKRIQDEGFLAFDVVLAIPEMMKVVGRLGKILGPRKLMPNPKTGTVTNDLATTVKEYKSGKVNFQADAGGVIQTTIGRKSFEVDALVENFDAFVKHVVRHRPPGAKGIYIKKIFLSTTMSPSVRIDVKQALAS